MTEYIINGVAYHPKERYSLKVWARILEILRTLPLSNGGTTSEVTTAVAILGSDTLPELLTLILDAPVEGELYDDDIDDVQRAINDFFLRKKSLMTVSANRTSE